MRRPLRCLLVVPALAGLLAGSAGALAGAAWPTYHLDAARNGDDSSEPSFRNLQHAWTSPALDGAIYAEPLVYGGNVIVVTENDSVYAFNAGSGAAAWATDPVRLGTPRTSNFPCGDVDPLGITGTPVIDGGYLYTLAEVENPPGTYRFHLAKLSAASGALVWNHDITPSGMSGITSYQQQRSALTVSNGNVVIPWGGLDGDCGPYHGFLETVSEATGAEVHEWSDTTRSGDREGGMWATSGPAVDTAGNIYVSTGNGAVSDITQYAGDYGDSVLKFSPALGSPVGFFAPGPPQSWASLNAADADLGSMGPSLLPDGLMFAIGKGGRGYLLNPASLPDNSNPGGGENHSAQVCSATNGAAFGGLAVAGNIVYVPCADGIAAVSVDSSTSFHTVWNQTSGGGAAPIVAGSLVWTVDTFGGTTLYGLDPSSGSIVAQLSLPNTTEHFATPAAGDNRLFMGDGNQVVAFVPPSPPPAPATGGYVLDGWGGVHPYGGASAVSASAWWPGWDIARGIVMRPDRASGYVLDGYGGINPYGLATPIENGAYFGWDIARAIALDPCDSSGDSGYTLDGYGGVHSFGSAPPVTGSAYWYGWDIARGIALNSCAGGTVSGYVLDGWGGLHPFWQRGTPPIAKPAGGPYWPGWDIARGVIITSAGMGEVLDGWGGLHPFGGGPAVTETGYTQGLGIARAVTYAPSLHGGCILDAYGDLHTWWVTGDAALAAPSNQTHWSWQIARAAAQ